MTIKTAIYVIADENGVDSIKTRMEYNELKEFAPLSFEVYIDKGLSRIVSFFNRPKGKEIKQEVLEGRINKFVFKNIDAIAKNKEEMYKVLDFFIENNVPVFSAETGFLTDGERLLANITSLYEDRVNGLLSLFESNGVKFYYHKQFKDMIRIESPSGEIEVPAQAMKEFQLFVTKTLLGIED